MKDLIKLNKLYDCYGELLTDKQKDYFTSYYFDNLSLQEIAENNQVSRTAVGNSLKQTNKKLEEFERVIKNVKFKDEIQVIIKKDNIKEIKNEIQNLLDK